MRRRASARATRRGRSTDQLAVYPVGAVDRRASRSAPCSPSCCRAPSARTGCSAPTGRKLAGAAREAAQQGIDAGRERAQDLSGELGSKVGRAVAEAVGAKDCSGERLPLPARPC